MKLRHAITFALILFLVSAAGGSEVSWMFRPGYYTHSPITGKRVAQFEPDTPSYVSYDPTYQESGYRHQTIQAGNEWVNIVQTWARGPRSGPTANGSIPIVPERRPTAPGAIRKVPGRCLLIPGGIPTA